MLKPIRTTLQRRQEDIQQRTDVATTVRRAVSQYILEYYPDAVSRVSVRYEAVERLVIINTPSKTLAGELMMNTREIRAYLAGNQIQVDRIIAR